MIPWSLLRARRSMLQSQTTMLARLQAESIAITSAFLLFFLVCALVLLQSRLIKAARHWTQHGASAIQPHSSGSLSRTRTSAAELYYLRYMRSCAATAFGNKGGGTSPTFLSKCLVPTSLRDCYIASANMYACQ